MEKNASKDYNSHIQRSAVLIPYFGKWPDWIELYFFSCKQNKLIDWYFFTDCIDVDFQDENLYFRYFSFVDYCFLVSQKLQINFMPEKAYKLCDIRPFFGYIHQNIISDYDFWGFADVDIVWGDIGKFYTQRKLKKYDILSASGDRISGHFCLIRNTVKFREMCFKIKDWKLKICDTKNLALDEFDFSLTIFPEGKWLLLFYKLLRKKLMNWRNAWVIYYHVQPLFRLLFLTNLRKIYYKEQHTTPILSDDGLTCKNDSDTWFYINGKVINDKTKKENIYCHFQLFKKNNFYTYYFWGNNYYTIPDKYNFNLGVKISKNGIEPLNK